MDETYMLGSSSSIYTNLEGTSQPRYYTGGRQGIEIGDLLRQMSGSRVRPKHIWLFGHFDGVWLLDEQPPGFSEAELRECITNARSIYLSWWL